MSEQNKEFLFQSIIKSQMAKES